MSEFVQTRVMNLWFKVDKMARKESSFMTRYVENAKTAFSS